TAIMADHAVSIDTQATPDRELSDLQRSADADNADDSTTPAPGDTISTPTSSSTKPFSTNNSILKWSARIPSSNQDPAEDMMVSQKDHLARAGSRTPSQPHNSATSSSTCAYNSGGMEDASDPREELNKALREELGPSIKIDVSGFHEAVFSRVSKLDDLAQTLFSSCKHGEEPAYWECGGWDGWPPEPNEKDVLVWLQTFTSSLREQLRKVDSSMRATNPRKLYQGPGQILQGSTAKRKMDVGIAAGNRHEEVDKNDAEDLDRMTRDWSEIHVAGELKKNAEMDSYDETFIDIASYVGEIFRSQNRRFVLDFTLCASTMRLWHFDRSGSCGSGCFDINQHSLDFLRVVLGFLPMTDEQLGLDPTIQTIDGKQFLRVTRDYRSEQIFLVERLSHDLLEGLLLEGWSKDTLVVKDSWEYEEKSEGGMLFKEATELGVKNVAGYYYHETVRVGHHTDDTLTHIRGGSMTGSQNFFRQSRGLQKTDGSALESQAIAAAGQTQHPQSSRKRSAYTAEMAKRSWTEKYRTEKYRTSVGSSKTSEPLHTRIHRRMITYYVGKAIYKASTLKDTINGFLGAIEGPKSLVEANILHRDLSINSIILGEDEEGGFLIDLDLAVKINDIHESSTLVSRISPVRPRMLLGTKVFVAIGALRGETRTVLHDLESFFWSLLWICLHHRGSGKEHITSQPFERWGYIDAHNLYVHKSGLILHGIMNLQSICGQPRRKEDIFSDPIGTGEGQEGSGGFTIMRQEDNRRVGDLWGMAANEAKRKEKATTMEGPDPDLCIQQLYDDKNQFECLVVYEKHTVWTAFKGHGFRTSNKQSAAFGIIVHLEYLLKSYAGVDTHPEDLSTEELLAELKRMRLENVAKERLFQNTTLYELLQACHDYLFEKLKVELRPELTSRGSISDPTGKLCPTSLRPWRRFPAIQQSIYDEICAALRSPHEAARMFPSVKGIQDQGRMLDGLICSEADLRHFQQTAVQQYVEIALKDIASLPSFRPVLGDGLKFHNHSHALQDGEAEVQAVKQKKAGPSKVPQPSNADQLCAVRIGDETWLIFIIEYKAPHKLTLQILQAALSGEMDVKQVRNRVDSSTSKDDKFIEDAQKLVAAAATQTYTYMLQGGLAYGCIVTGEAIVFLHIKKDSPHDLYYHLVIMSEQVKSNADATPDYSLTAISQLLTFSVLAARTAQYDADWRTKAVRNADTWAIDYDLLERQLETPRNEMRKSPEHSEYKVPKVHLSKSYRTRSKRDDDDDDDDTSDDDHHGRTSTGSSEYFPDVDTPSKSNKTRSVNANDQKGGRGSSTRHPQRRCNYCTLKCLLGLVQGMAIDQGCPNAARHPRRPEQFDRHLIGPSKLKRLVRKQLGTTLNKNCTNLKMHGARGMPFQITLESHGYVFVGKGTVDVFVPDLKHEGAVYNRLRSLQGTYTPVYLGNIDLISNWYEYAICIQHMLLMSYGGTSIRTKDLSMQTQIEDFEHKLDQLGIQHRDLWERNMLWNGELQRLIFIDFERSTIEPRRKKTPARNLQERSPNEGRLNKQPLARLSPNISSTKVKNEIKKAPTAITIFDEENMPPGLRIPSPKRPFVEQEDSVKEPASKRPSQGEKFPKPLPP
ncbi:MAG: hypothetical protein Q9181_005385, partial [Wetmoreana brouardii]